MTTVLCPGEVRMVRRLRAEGKSWAVVSRRLTRAGYLAVSARRPADPLRPYDPRTLRAAFERTVSKSGAR